MNIHKILRVMIRPFRIKRMLRFIKIIKPQSTDNILDVGGTAYNWELINFNNKVVLLNLIKESDNDKPDKFSIVVGDGTSLEYADNEFDIVFSNSVIEHVGSYQKQEKFALEVARARK